MKPKHVLFSFEGRINRAIYWKYAFIFAVPYIICIILDVIIFDVPGMLSIEKGVGPFSLVLTFIFLWPGLALMIKRLHDRNRSGWFILIMFIPIIAIWPLIEILFIKGTSGNNRFGPDPLS